MEPLSVGEAAARLGVAASTVRMWGRRYGLTASARSAGGHRRYTPEDLERLADMHAAVISGTSPAVAAAAVLAGAAGQAGQAGEAAEAAETVEAGEAAEAGGTGRARVARRPGGPGGSVLAVPGGGRAVRGLARAAFRLDEMGVEDAVVEALGRDGTLPTWDGLLRPVLVAAGNYWQRTGEGIEIEHLLTQAVSNAFVRHVAAVAKFAQDDPILLAGGPQEEHTLALHAARAGLAERGVPARLLGPRTPLRALATAARRTRAPGVLIWSSIPDAVALDELPLVTSAHRRIVVLLGGSGWQGLPVGAVRHCADLSQSVELLVSAWRRRPGAAAAPAAPTSAR